MNRMRSALDLGGTGRSTTFESYADVECHIARAHRLRSEVSAQLLAAAYRGTAAALRALGTRVASWRRQRRTYEVLTRCSDRTLADIGIANDCAVGLPQAPSRRRCWNDERTRQHP